MVRDNSKDQIVELRIEDTAFGGDGVARMDRLVVMVRGGLPGDLVSARLTKKHRRHVEARIAEIIEPSPHRVAPRCELAGMCGGCAVQHLDYAKQLEGKRSQVYELLSRIGGFDEPNVLQAAGMADPWRYRNKMEYAFSAFGDGRLKLGLHSAGRYDLVLDVDDCMLQPENCNSIRNRARAFFRESGIAPYHLRNHEGALRHLVLRTANRGRDVMAIVCTADEKYTDGGFAAEMMSEFPEIKGVLVYVNKSRGGAAVAGDGTLVRGEGRLVDEILGVKLEVSATSFAQTNSAQAEVLYESAIDMCRLDGGENVFDLYSGTGPISLLLAKRARKVTGIECVPDAVDDARRNARANGITNVEFVHGEVEAVLASLSESSPPDVVLVDPPRAGLHKNALKAMIGSAPRRIVYVSCNPATLARDASELREAGYALEQALPVDMFPHTYHIECVSAFTRAV